MGVRSGLNETHLFKLILVVLELIIWYAGINFIFFMIAFICFCSKNVF